MQQALPSPAMAGGRAKPRAGEGGVRGALPPRAEGNGTAAGGTFHLSVRRGGGGAASAFRAVVGGGGVRGTARSHPLLRPRCGSSQPSPEGQGRGTGTAEGARAGGLPGAALRGLREETLGSRGLPGAPGAGETSGSGAEGAPGGHPRERGAARDTGSRGDPRGGVCMGLPLERGERFLEGFGPLSHTLTHTWARWMPAETRS